MKMKKILILDSNSLLNRAFYAIPTLTTSKGLNTNGIFGYLMMFFKMQEEFECDYVISTFDRKAKTFRHLEYENYKAGRKSMPNELREQIDPLKEILRAMNINIFELDGFEADDLIGTFSKVFESMGFEPIIVTGDKDALQLCSHITKVIITKKGITDKDVYDHNKMLEIYGVTPSEFVDVKALMGDKSDNIPGVSGIGEKGAINLIKEYKSIENIYKNIDDMKEGRIKNNLIKDMEVAFLSKKLSKINRDVPICFNFEDFKLYKDFNKEEVFLVYREYELNSLVNKIGYKLKEDSDISLINLNKDGVEKLLDELRNSDEILYLSSKVCGNKISNLKLEKLIFNFKNKCYLLDENLILNNFNLISKIFEDDIKKVCFDSKQIYKVMLKNNIDVCNLIFDITLGEYLINPGKECKILNLCEKYANICLNEENEDLGIFYFKDIYEHLIKILKDNNMENLYFNIEHPLCMILAKTELEGFNISVETLNELKEKFEIKIKEYSEKIYRLAGEEFNINSPKQLGVILFEKMDLPVIKKTKTGYSTNAEVLEFLKDKHVIIEEIINYRQITKLHSTYINGLLDVIDDDGKIHTSFNQTITTTGRLSSTEPNLQNIPIKYALGREIRRVFIPTDKDSVILSADYSQIELRVLAHISKDEKMIEAFKENLDIHKITASEIFSVNEEDVTSEMRSKCKAVNFGIIYGISDFALSNDLRISRKEAKDYMDKYFNKYVGVRKYLDDIIKFSKENGYVSTIFNRIRSIPEIRSSNRIVRSLGERLSMNTPIQGSAADIIKLAMINVFNKLNSFGLRSKIILQVHDELVLNVYKDELCEVSSIVKEEMENCYKDMLVPLVVNLSHGENWFEAK